MTTIENMYKKFHKRVVKLLPSKDLIKCVNEQGFIFKEEELLKFIDCYAPSFDEKLALFEEATRIFTEKQSIRHAKKLIAYNKKMYDYFISDDCDCVYEVKIKCMPDDADEETMIVKSFSDAVEMIKCWLKCYANVGAKDNKYARYTVKKKTTTLPARPYDIYCDKVGLQGACVLGHKFKILDLYVARMKNEMNCKTLDCEECKMPCIGMISPRFPHFLEKYDLVAFHSNLLHAPHNICYGIFVGDMDECDYDSYVVLLDNEYIINRRVSYKDENGWYPVFRYHSHDSYDTLFKPDLMDVPQNVLDDYAYAVEELRKIDNEGNKG